MFTLIFLCILSSITFCVVFYFIFFFHLPAPVAAAAPDANDPTAYYNDFWAYASYYGEAAARVYYTTWAPPVGTPAPPGVVVAADPGSSGPDMSGVVPGEAMAGSGVGGGDESMGSAMQSDSVVGDVADLSIQQQQQQQQQQGVESEDPDVAWEAYKKQVGGGLYEHSKNTNTNTIIVVKH